MDHGPIFLASGTLNDDRIVSAPMNAGDALHRLVEMRLQGFQMLTLTDTESGNEIDIERFMLGNPSEMQ
jgi:hypothetical protein